MMAPRHPNHRPLSSLPPELRRTSVPSHVREWVQAATGAAVVKVARLDGASSVALHRLDLTDGTQVALRRYVWPKYLQSEPEAPGREVDAIRFARAQGLPAPELIACDTSGQDVGDGIPVLLTSFLPGRPNAVPDLNELAKAAAMVHSIDAKDLGHEYFPWYEEEMTTPPPLTTRPGLWERAIELWRSRLPSYHPTFIHRDFHPGNLLWSHGQLTGIVDWASACRGPIGCDIAHCRANLRDLAGPEIADRFVTTYSSITGDTLDPFWVMAGHLEHDHAHWTKDRLAADEPDLEHAVHALLAQPVK